uniref:Uncharacterized protein n=1 Tax=Leersia perrieri TaxID=77586 RepID=A0A0D9VM49_9ORYZ
MAMEINSPPSTVGDLLAKASTAAAPVRECPSPRSLLSRIFHRGHGGGGGGFGCRLRLPRYCSSGGAAKEDTAAKAETPRVVARREPSPSSPRSSLGKNAAAAAKEEMEVSPPASLGLGASLVLLLSKSAAELNRMAELRAEMERIVLDGANRNSASVDEHAGGGGESDALSRCSRTAAAPANGGGITAAGVAMDQMEAELEAELTRLQFSTSNNATPRLDDPQLEIEPKGGVDDDEESTDTDGVDDDTLTDIQCDGDDEEEEIREEGGGNGGVSARELERRLHELLQWQQESRIAELETELERAKRKLHEKEREVCWWRNTAKLVTRHKDDSRLR